METRGAQSELSNVKILDVPPKYFISGVLPKCKRGRVPVCDCSKSSAQHQTPRTDSLHAQVLIQDKDKDKDKHQNSIEPNGHIL